MASQVEGDDVSAEDVASFNDMASMSFASSRDMGRGSGDGVAVAGAVEVDMAAGKMSVAQAHKLSLHRHKLSLQRHKLSSRPIKSWRLGKRF